MLTPFLKPFPWTDERGGGMYDRGVTSREGERISFSLILFTDTPVGGISHGSCGDLQRLGLVTESVPGARPPPF